MILPTVPFVGVDQGEGVGALPIVGERGAFDVRHGQTSDGAGAGIVSAYLDEAVVRFQRGFPYGTEGARWKDLPASYPSPSTCWRRLRLWEEQEIWVKAWRAFLAQLDRQGQLDLAETFADGSFAPAKKGGLVSASPRRAKGRSGWG